MRKLILISAFVLASVSAQAGDGRNLNLAASDEPRAVETAKPEATKPEATNSDVAKSESAATDVKADTARPGKRQASRPARRSYVRSYEGDEAKARRIAARYGVYW